MMVDSEEWEKSVVAYKLAAEKLRAKLVIEASPLEGEIFPINGRLLIDLSGTPLAPDRVAALCAHSEINIPECRLALEGRL